MQKRLFLAFCLVAVNMSFVWSSTVDSLLTVLEKEIEQSDVYIARKQEFINSLCAMRPMTPELELRIAREYQHFQSDSSRVWYLKLTDCEEPLRTEALMGFVKLLASSGYHIDAAATISDNEDVFINSIEGCKMVWLLYTDIANETQVPSIREQALQNAQHYYDAMMRLYEREAPTSREAYFWYELYKAQEREDWDEALRNSEQLLAMVTPDDHMYAILAYGHAMLYEGAGNASKRLEWLVRSAITDVRCGITDNGSVWLVAQDCFDAGALQRAYKFSDYSLTNAIFFNAPTRYIQNFIGGHLIASRYEYELRRSSILMIVLLVLLGLVLIAMFIIAMYSLRQNKRLHAMNRDMKTMNGELRTINRELKEADKVKEQYICRYLEVHSDYIRRLTTMARRAGEKDTSAFMEREMENFYRSFDDTFLSLYGTFVQDFNALLKPEAQVTPKPGERMTIEMRIFALILLGITSSSKIAELLCYSPNTISNYRVKMKNGALGDRDTFETRIRQIGNNNAN